MAPPLILDSFGSKKSHHPLHRYYSPTINTKLLKRLRDYLPVILVKIIFFTKPSVFKNVDGIRVSCGWGGEGGGEGEFEKGSQLID